jgi:hypothetical protein
VVSGSFGFAVLVILLLVLLLPVERIRRLSIKSMKTEGAVEMEELAKAAQTVSRSRHGHATRSARGEPKDNVGDTR